MHHYFYLTWVSLMALLWAPQAATRSWATPSEGVPGAAEALAAAGYVARALAIREAAGPVVMTCTQAAQNGLRTTDALLRQLARPLHVQSNSSGVLLDAARFPSIQAAIDALPSRGGTVCIPRGRFTGQVAIRKSDVRLLGTGASSIVTASADRHIIMVLNGARNVLISNLQIQGQARNEDTQQKCVYVTEYAKAVRVHRILLAGVDDHAGCNIGIHLDPRTSGNIVSSNRVTQVIGTESGHGYGVLIVGSSNNLVTHDASVFTASQGRHHVYLSTGASDNKIVDNYAISGTAAQIHINGGNELPACRRNVIAGNFLMQMDSKYPWNGAVHIAGSSRENQVEGNTIVDPRPVGIHIESAPGENGGADYNIVSSNLVYHSRRFGILISGASHTQLISNTVYDASQEQAGSYPGIQLAALGNAQPSGTKITANSSYGPNQRCALRILQGRYTVLRGNHLAPGKNQQAIVDHGAFTVSSGEPPPALPPAFATTRD